MQPGPGSEGEGAHLLAHPLGHGQLVLLLAVLLAEDDGGQQANCKLNLLGPGKHLRSVGARRRAAE